MSSLRISSSSGPWRQRLALVLCYSRSLGGGQPSSRSLPRRTGCLQWHGTRPDRAPQRWPTRKIRTALATPCLGTLERLIKKVASVELVPENVPKKHTVAFLEKACKCRCYELFKRYALRAPKGHLDWTSCGTRMDARKKKLLREYSREICIEKSNLSMPKRPLSAGSGPPAMREIFQPV